MCFARDQSDGEIWLEVNIRIFISSGLDFRWGHVDGLVDESLRQTCRAQTPNRINH